MNFHIKNINFHFLVKNYSKRKYEQLNTNNNIHQYNLLELECNSVLMEGVQYLFVYFYTVRCVTIEICWI